MDDFLLKQQLDVFLREDLGHGDLTTESIFNDHETGQARFVAKESLVTAGMGQVAARVFQRLDPAVQLLQAMEDGVTCPAGTVIFEVAGPVKALLRGERVALNLVQRLSGIATLTQQYVKQVQGHHAKITDTRKTTPGLRMFEKYAVRCGGGHNHRFHLSDGVMIKDNHIAACGSIEAAVQRARQRCPHTIRIEVETENLTQVKACLAAGVDIIMLDNMSTLLMEEAVSLINGQALVEASGGVDLTRVAEIAATGVDYISIGRLTHSAPARDISMRWVPPATVSC